MIIRALINAALPQPPTNVTQRMDRHCLPKKKRGIRFGESVAIMRLTVAPARSDTTAPPTIIRIQRRLPRDVEETGSTQGGEGPRPERNNWDSSCVGRASGILRTCPNAHSGPDPHEKGHGSPQQSATQRQQESVDAEGCDVITAQSRTRNCEFLHAARA